MLIRRTLVAVTAAAAAALPLAAAPAGPASAATATTITVHTPTLRPADGFDYAITGRVSGPTHRHVLLLEKVGTRWQLDKVVNTSRRHHYRFTTFATDQPVTYRVVAPIVAGSGGAISRRLRTRPTIGPKQVVAVNHRSCVVLSSDSWRLGFTAHLATGEWLQLTIHATGLPYLGTMTSNYGGSYHTHADFHSTCYPNS